MQLLMCAHYSPKMWGCYVAAKSCFFTFYSLDWHLSRSGATDRWPASVVAGYPFNFWRRIESGPLVSVGQVWQQLRYKFSCLGVSLAVRWCHGAAVAAPVIADRCRWRTADTITQSLAGTTAYTHLSCRGYRLTCSGHGTEVEVQHL